MTRQVLVQPRSKQLSAYPLAVLKNHPQGYYRMNEASGPTAFDLSPDKRNGMYHGGVTYGVKGPSLTDLSTAITFDSFSGYISIPNMPYNLATNNWEISEECRLWIPSGNATQGLMLTSSITTRGFGLYFSSANIISILANGVLGQPTTYTLATGAWLHICFTRKFVSGSTFTWTVYVNGTNVYQANQTAGSLDTGTAYIGQIPGNGYIAPNCKMCDVAFYGYALSASQVAADALAALV